MLDFDLAKLYGVATMVLNQQVKRNMRRFPDDFMFKLNESEKKDVITNCDNMTRLKFSHHLPNAFTEHGVAMLSSVLKSDRAVEMNILVIRVFIKLREILASNKELAHKIEELERAERTHAFHINKLYKLLGKLISEPEKPKRPMGFERP